MKTYRGVDVWIHIFLTSALVGGEWSASRPCPFTPGTHFIGGWVDPRAGLDDMEKWKFFTLQGLELPLPLVVQPVASRYTDWAIPAYYTDMKNAYISTSVGGVRMLLCTQLCMMCAPKPVPALFLFILSFSFIVITRRSRWHERWERGFESHLRHGCLFAFILCLCCSLCRKRPCDGMIPRPRSPTDCV
jgi:hypothetical protein